jgi:hypothetical protein
VGVDEVFAAKICDSVDLGIGSNCDRHVEIAEFLLSRNGIHWFNRHDRAVDLEFQKCFSPTRK